MGCEAHNINGKSYIGSAVDLSRRLSRYYQLSQLVKNNMVIYKAILKYGYSNFSLEILEYCNIEVLLEREQFYLDSFDPEYNIHPTAGSWLGAKHSVRKRRGATFPTLRVGKREKK